MQDGRRFGEKDNSGPGLSRSPASKRDDRCQLNLPLVCKQPAACQHAPNADSARHRNPWQRRPKLRGGPGRTPGRPRAHAGKRCGGGARPPPPENTAQPRESPVFRVTSGRRLPSHSHRLHPKGCRHAFPRWLTPGSFTYCYSELP